MDEFNWEELDATPQSDRHKYCGRTFTKIDPSNPDKKLQFTYTCGDHRNCLYCRKQKAKRELELLIKAQEGSKAVVTICLDEEAKRLNRRLRERDIDYRSYPQSNGTVVVLHLDETEGQSVNSFSELPLDKWIGNIPLKRRISGRGKMIATKTSKPIAEEDKNFIMIWTFAVWANALQTLCDALWDQAVLETVFNELEFEKSLQTRMKRYKHLLEEAGYVTYCVPIHEMIVVDDIPGNELMPV